MRKGLRGSSAELLRRRSRVFTFRDALEVSGCGEGYLRLLLHRLERRRLIHPYSDECDALLLVYSLQEIFAEKVRSVFERIRPRDLYDVWYLSRMVELKEVVPVIKRKFEHRGVELRMERSVSESVGTIPQKSAQGATQLRPGIR